MFIGSCLCPLLFLYSSWSMTVLFRSFFLSYEYLLGFISFLLFLLIWGCLCSHLSNMLDHEIHGCLIVCALMILMFYPIFFCILYHLSNIGWGVRSLYYFFSIYYICNLFWRYIGFYVIVIMLFCGSHYLLGLMRLDLFLVYVVYWSFILVHYMIYH